MFFVLSANIQNQKMATFTFFTTISDEGLIRQVQQSREDRQDGHVYGQEAGLEYLRMKVEEFERGQSL